jgi:hypothetical protein
MPYFILPVDLLSFLMSAAAVRKTDLADAAAFANTLPKPGVGQSRTRRFRM